MVRPGPTLPTENSSCCRRLRLRKPDDEAFLRRIDRPAAVVCPDPGDRLAGRMTAQHYQGGQGCPRAAMASQAADFYPLASPSSIEQRAHTAKHRLLIPWYVIVRPVEVLVGPGRPPSQVEVEPVIRCLVSPIRVAAVEGHRSDGGSVGHEDRRTMPMQWVGQMFGP